MASTGTDRPVMAEVRSIHNEKLSMDETPIAHGVDDEVRAPSLDSDESTRSLFDSTHRKLKPRHIQLIGIGGYAKNRAELRCRTC